MQSDIGSVAAAWAAQKVKRWSSNVTVSEWPQTNADHIGGCLTLLFMLRPNPSVALVRHLVFHDIGERWAGDLPWAFKQDDPETAAAHARSEKNYAWVATGQDLSLGLTDEERALVKLIDMLDPYAHVALRCPFELAHNRWPEQINEILDRAEALGLLHEVVSIIDDMKARRF